MLNTFLSRFTHHQIDKEELFEQFGSLLAFECSYWIFPVQTTNPEQRIITQIDTEYEDTNELHIVSCQSSHSDEDVYLDV